MNLLDLAIRIGINPVYVAGTQGGEYHSPCPSCSGKDRFRIQPFRKMTKCIGFYSCRKCEKSGDAIQFCRDFLKMSYNEAVKFLNLDVDLKISQAKEISIKPAIKENSEIWHKKAKNFIDHCSKEIVKYPKFLEWLSERGLPRDAVFQYQIGYNTLKIERTLEDWGLPTKENKKIVIPGNTLTIPTFEPSGKVTRIKLRNLSYEEGKFEKYFYITGSKKGLNLIGDKSLFRNGIIITESELDAYAIHWQVGNQFLIISVGGKWKNIDEVSDYYLERTPFILVCHDNDTSGKEQFAKFCSLYGNKVFALPVPISMGKDIGEAVRQGLKLKEFILNNLPYKSETFLYSINDLALEVYKIDNSIEQEAIKRQKISNLMASYIEPKNVSPDILAALTYLKRFKIKEL